jgi:hypothetical protein
MRTCFLLLPLLAACSGTRIMEPAEDPTDPPGTDEAKVVVYRDSFRNASKPYAFFDDEELLGFAQVGAWFEVRVKPGEHFFHLHGVSSHGVRATLAAGKTYTLRVDSVPELFRLQLRLTPVVPGMEDFAGIDGILAGLERREPVDAALAEYAERHADEVEERLAFLLTDGRDQAVELKAEAGR